MPYVTDNLVIDAPLAEVWDLLLDKVQQPERYLPNIKAVKILQRMPNNSLLRILELEGFEVLELVTIDEQNKQIIFELKEHPLFSGTVTNKLEENDEQVKFTITLNWLSSQIAVEHSAQDKAEKTVKDALFRIKTIAEGQDLNHTES